MYKLEVFNYGEWSKGYSCFIIRSESKTVWIGSRFGQNIRSDEFTIYVNELEFICGELGLCLHREEPSIYEWKVSPLTKIENVQD
jgi:abortive infection bacteriophage resistance protein